MSPSHSESHGENRIRVALLFGGVSSEHAVSVVTAQSVLNALDSHKYEVLPIGITRQGKWTLAPASAEVIQVEDAAQVSESGTAVELYDGAGTPQLLSVQVGQESVDLGRVDVVFPLLHGPFGEDGTIQGLLELLSVPYVGSGVLASAAGMDKHFMKVIFASAGLTIGPYEVITDHQWLFERDEALERINRLSYPLFVKPARAGSSMGITKVETAQDLVAAVEAAREHDPKVLVEQGVSGREIEVGVLDGAEGAHARATLPGEIDVQPGEHGFYDFEAKYIDGDAAQLSCPANLPEEDIQRVRELALQAFGAIGAEGLARVDFFYTPEGEFVINEINTMPGFTQSSMYPQMWAKTGIAYPELIDELIQLALARKVGLR